MGKMAYMSGSHIVDHQTHLHLVFRLIRGQIVWKSKKTAVYVDFKDLYDSIWKRMHDQESKERRDIGFGPYIVEYLLRPMFEKKEG
jgi:hypothetical protein